MTIHKKSSKNRLSIVKKWGKLSLLCERMRFSWYVKHDARMSKRLARNIGQVLKDLPQSRLAIIRQEALALVNEVNGDIQSAIKHRKREIELIGRLHHEVEKSLQQRKTTKKMANRILGSRSARGLQKRQAIVQKLERLRSSIKGDR